ncbi:hypothetical protein [Deinococcus humi]|uniref:Uncharacterized protein n=1 Tax=Deinococcus humi TaxID=662880 RepID=A0A7W8JVY3_9DEIO|nr:hypothetical protein [Deinococcus humi]
MNMDADRLETLMAAEVYWTALAMKQQGSRFYRAIGEALEAADVPNRRRIYQTWPDAVWDFYLRGLRLEAGEASPSWG